MVSAPTQPAPPALPGERTQRPPWRPRVSGIVGLLCGPLAAGFIAFINLRRLNERRKAAWTLILTMLACVAFGVAIALLPDNISTNIGKLLGNFVSPFLYPLLQNHAFDEWERSHPEVAHANGWRTFGWALLGLVAFFVIVIGAALGVSGNSEVRDIEVRYTMPETAKVGETVTYFIDIHNTSDRPQLLYGLDIDTHFLEGISVLKTSPAFTSSEPNMLAPIRSYVFRQSIPPKGVVEIEVQGLARKAGSFPLKLDVCVKTALVCSSLELGAVTIQ